MSKEGKGLPGWFKGMKQGAADHKAEQAQKGNPHKPSQPPKNGGKK